MDFKRSASRQDAIHSVESSPVTATDGRHSLQLSRTVNAQLNEKDTIVFGSTRSRPGVAAATSPATGNDAKQSKGRSTVDGPTSLNPAQRKPALLESDNHSLHSTVPADNMPPRSKNPDGRTKTGDKQHADGSRLIRPQVAMGRPVGATTTQAMIVELTDELSEMDEVIRCPPISPVPPPARSRQVSPQSRHSSPLVDDDEDGSTTTEATSDDGGHWPGGHLRQSWEIAVGLGAPVPDNY